MGFSRLVAVLVLFSLIIVSATKPDDLQCMTWAMKRILGDNDVTVVNDVMKPNSTANEPRPTRPSDVEPYIGHSRPGKRGAIGPPGIRGPVGPQGVCDCIPEEVRTLQRENEDLKEKLRRIRLTSPETFCLLGMKDRSIPDSAITASSRPGDTPYARLDYASHGWYPSAYSVGQWIMVDLGRVRPVTGLVTQGRHNYDSWTTSYKVEHSVDGNNFTDVKKTDGSEMVFPGNSDRSTKVVNRFPEPVSTRFVRIYPMSFQHAMFIRFDVIDC